MKIVMIAGRIRAGKTTVAQMLTVFLKQFGVMEINFSDALGDTLDVFDVPKERRYYSEFATALKATSFGAEIFNRAVTKRIREIGRKPDFLILCGPRYRDNLDVLAGHDSVVVGVTAPIDDRYARSIAGDKDRVCSFDDFEIADRAPTEWDIDYLLEHADFVIDNSRGLHELSEMVNVLAKKLAN